ncbi:hypothetical protein HDU93_007660 [Gonapodya sp. JEL0774]|nr:hypothetical protein HDU93_007660 [Gonapodya sp. JEL0774]
MSTFLGGFLTRSSRSASKRAQLQKLQEPPSVAASEMSSLEDERPDFTMDAAESEVQVAKKDVWEMSVRVHASYRASSFLALSDPVAFRPQLTVGKYRVDGATYTTGPNPKIDEDEWLAADLRSIARILAQDEWKSVVPVELASALLLTRDVPPTQPPEFHGRVQAIGALSSPLWVPMTRVPRQSGRPEHWAIGIVVNNAGSDETKPSVQPPPAPLPDEGEVNPNPDPLLVDPPAALPQGAPEVDPDDSFAAAWNHFYRVIRPGKRWGKSGGGWTGVAARMRALHTLIDQFPHKKAREVYGKVPMSYCSYNMNSNMVRFVDLVCEFSPPLRHYISTHPDALKTDVADEARRLCVAYIRENGFAPQRLLFFLRSRPQSWEWRDVREAVTTVGGIDGSSGVVVERSEDGPVNRRPADADGDAAGSGSGSGSAEMGAGGDTEFESMEVGGAEGDFQGFDGDDVGEFFGEDGGMDLPME